MTQTQSIGRKLVVDGIYKNQVGIEAPSSMLSNPTRPQTQYQETATNHNQQDSMNMGSPIRHRQRAEGPQASALHHD